MPIAGLALGYPINTKTLKNANLPSEILNDFCIIIDEENSIFGLNIQTTSSIKTSVDHLVNVLAIKKNFRKFFPELADSTTINRYLYLKQENLE